MSAQNDRSTASRESAEPHSFQYLAAAGRGQDYLVAAFDTKQLRDRETPMTLDLSNLADRKQPTASFSPVFTPQRIRPYVAPVMLRKVDEQAVVRGTVCPVCGEARGKPRAGGQDNVSANIRCISAARSAWPAVRQDPAQFCPGRRCRLPLR